MIDILSKLEQELRYEANMDDRVGVAIGALMVFRRLKDDSLTSTWCHLETEEVEDGLRESIARTLRNLADSIYNATSEDLSDTSHDIVQMVNSLGNMLVDTAGKGYVSSNDLDYANECLDRIAPLLKIRSKR